MFKVLIYLVMNLAGQRSFLSKWKTKPLSYTMETKLFIYILTLHGRKKHGVRPSIWLHVIKKKKSNGLPSWMMSFIVI